MEEKFKNKIKLLDLIGNTPLLDVSFLSPKKDISLFAKAEWMNPGGSLKDRPVKRMLKEAIKSGELSQLITGVVAISSQRFGTQTVEKLKKPLLLIHGSKDEILDMAASEDIFQRASQPKRLEILDGAGHGLMEVADRVQDLITNFITMSVGGSNSDQ